jgi:glycosyltransferase involved in cell wall biosynthesis
LNNGYDLDLFKPCAESRCALRGQWNIASETPVIGIVARFDPYKDHSNFLTAIAYLRKKGLHFEVVMIGSDIVDGNPALQAIIDSTQCGSVRLLGQRFDVPEILNALDLCVLASSAEAFPNVLAEAMACGTPCVSTDVGDVGQILGDTGWIVPPKNSLALAEAIDLALHFHQNRDHWRERGSLGRMRVSELFSINLMARSYKDLWLQCLN